MLQRSDLLAITRKNKENTLKKLENVTNPTTGRNFARIRRTAFKRYYCER